TMQVNEFGFNEPIGSAETNPFINQPAGGGGGGAVSFVKGLKHPWATLFHVAFKVVAILVYLFPFIFGGGFILSFIFCTLLLSFDFWTVKNVTGRLLVGLRWWNQVKDDGTNEWYFEQAPADAKYNQAESIVFWLSLYFTPVVWALFFLSCLISFSFNWMIITIIALSLSMANIYGFFKCAKGNNSNNSSGVASNYIGQALFNRASSYL
ncbi:hypothetical protein SAMD00019534_010150, partial [Acytostelium subglobosum LB1]|uniref:hypothetical protein n=1 Tax=Acytostelium subglobosum LB1 TaxID=1410327 RepID=UPI000644FD2D